MTRAVPAAQASTAPPGLRVGESLSGYLAQADSPEAGYRLGRREGRRASYRAAIVIPDLDAFLADPDHSAALEGSISVAGLGRDRPLESASIRLFCRREGRKRILYELPFHGDDGRRYALRGEKRIEDDAGPDVWKDMTTLYAEVAAQADGGESVTARGILRVSIATALTMGLTFRCLGRADPLGTARAALRFLAFSRAEINETYRKFLVPW